MSGAATPDASSVAEVVMPRLSDTMEQGTILRWLIADGEHVERGAELVEIETDKASMTYESDLEGTLQIVLREGESAAVGAPIARVGEQLGRAAQPIVRAGAPSPELERTAAAGEVPGEPAVIAAVAEAPREPAAAPPANGADPAGGLLATPLAQRAARVHGVALERLSGSGPRGRIVQSDVLAAAGLEPAPARALTRRPGAPLAAASDAFASDRAVRDGPPTTANGSTKGATRRVEATRAQQLVARRMAEAKATIPDFQVQTDVAMDAAIAFRAELRALLEDGAPSLNDLVVKACAIALRWHPRANASYSDGGFDEHERVNVGVAVASEQMLVVPVVQDADRKALKQIARETRLLAERVRLGAISPPELSGATFTVSNLGMYGMTQIVPVINPPQAAILGVGAIRETLAREAGEAGTDSGTPHPGGQASEIVERRLMTLTLSCDHRILYGADASLFLSDVKSILEAPLRLAL